MVRRARVDGEPVERAAEAFGFSRPSFYAAQTALDQGGLARAGAGAARAQAERTR